MLVRRHVKDDLRSLRPNKVEHSLAIGDIADDDPHLDPCLERLDLDGEVIEAALVHVDGHDAGGLQCQDLPDQFGPDRPARTGDEHGFAADQIAATCLVERGCLAADEILGSHVSEQSSRVSIAHPVDNVMCHLDLRGCALSDGENVSHCAPAGASHRQHDDVDVLFGDEGSQNVPAAHHLDAMDGQTVLARIVIQEGDDPVATSIDVSSQAADQELAQLPGAYTTASVGWAFCFDAGLARTVIAGKILVR